MQVSRLHSHCLDTIRSKSDTNRSCKWALANLTRLGSQSEKLVSCLRVMVGQFVTNVVDWGLSPPSNLLQNPILGLVKFIPLCNSKQVWLHCKTNYIQSFGISYIVIIIKMQIF